MKSLMGSGKKPSGESRDHKQGHDETHGNVISQFELGEPSNKAGQAELQVSATNPTMVGPNMGNFLFEVYLTPSDIKRDRLFIPVEQALGHFPPLIHWKQTYAETIKLSVGHNQMFTIINYDYLESVFVESKWWRHFVVWHNLKAWDVMRFYQPIQSSQDNHYLVDFLKRDEEKIAGTPEFKSQNFLFEVKLTQACVSFNRLVIPTENVRSHFPALGIPAETHGIERLYFTDATNGNWSIAVIAYGSRDPQYMLVIESEFVNKYNLEEGEVIRFYKPENRWSLRHFLIEFRGVNEVEIDSSSSGIEGSDSGPDRGNSGQGGGNGGGSNSGRRNRDGDGGGRSHSDRQKGWKFSWKLFACGRRLGRRRAASIK